MENCIFCKIVAGEIPCTKIYEDDNFLAFMDIRPSNKGHCLLVPKNHTTNLLEEDPKIGEELLKTIQKISTAVKEGLDATGVNVSTNIGSDAGQVIFHTHIHIIPRYKNDGLVHWPEKDINPADMAIQAEKIINRLD